VLVHGSFADASGWSGVITRLAAQGYASYAPSNPLRTLSGDAAYVRAFLQTIEGPIVLVGHSYGGAVITNAGTGVDNVTALVYINGFALAEGENVQTAGQLGNGPFILGDHIVVRPFPDSGEGNADAYIDPVWFHDLFCADLPDEQAAYMAVSQRPGALATLGEPSGRPAWAEKPSWYLASTSDRTIPVEAERAMGERAGSTFVEIESSHVAMISHPDEVTEMILHAATVGTESRTLLSV
jgi:pimeloyl-ACP methyl ester carboxylesterase